MSAWKDLEKRTVNKYDELGIDYIPIEKIIEDEVKISEYELFETDNFKTGIRLLLKETSEYPKRYTYTFGKVVVRTFKENPLEVEELIQKEEPIKFVWQKSKGGNRYIAIE